MFDEQAVEAINLGLKFGLGFIGEGLVWREIVLVRAGGHGRVAVAVVGILDRLIDVQRNHADGTDPTGLGHDEAVGR